MIYCHQPHCKLNAKPIQVPMGPEDPAVVVASLRRGMEALSALSTERAGERRRKTCFSLLRLLPSAGSAAAAAADWSLMHLKPPTDRSISLI